jgi:hypothetical protein
MISVRRRRGRIAAPTPKWGHSSQNRVTDRGGAVSNLSTGGPPERGTRLARIPMTR